MTRTQTLTTLSSAHARYFALDLFRGLAVISMIQGHTFTALLRASEYEGAWSTWHTLLHGLTAPMFLFGGGLAYGMVSARSTPPKDLRSDSALRARMLRRAAMLAAIGYGLQLPSFTRPVSDAAFGRAVQVGPLQLIAACLLCAEILRAFSARSRVSFPTMNLALGLCVSLVAPFVWKWRLSGILPLALGTWFDGYQGSTFPFFPWATFFFLGVYCSSWCSTLRSKRPAVLAGTLVGSGLLLSGTAYALFLQGLVLRSLYGNYELWHTSPLYVAFRLGLLFAILGTLSGFENLTKRLWPRLGALSQSVDLLSRHSLLAYVTHLLLLYGTMFTRGFAHVGQTLSFARATWTFFAILGATLFVVEMSERARALWRERSVSEVLGRAAYELWSRLSNVYGVRERKGTDAPAVE